ncbi:hypothetical protein [Streptomyces sp. NPDC046685]|uniref:hypothetical protein n=1 Tax=Streptomyces sp. NPDC046685 TaxID=3157202 RepID=UPI0034091D2A
MWSLETYGTCTGCGDENDILVVLGTYGTVAFLVYFPMGVLVRALRPWAAAMSIGFHLSIAAFMGLTGFALTMIACDLVFLSGTLDRLIAWVRSRRERTPRVSAQGDGSPDPGAGERENVDEAALV